MASRGTKQIRFGAVDRVLEKGRFVRDQHEDMMMQKGENTKDGNYHKGVADGLNVIITEMEKLGE